MNLKLNLGAEPKKVASLGGLLLVLIAVWLYPSGDAPPATGSTPTAPRPVNAPAAPPPVVRRDATAARGPATRAGSRQQLRSSVQDFKPKLFDKDNPVDPTKVDPTLASQTMARLQSIALSGGGRSLFDFGASTAAAPQPVGPIIKVPPKPKGNGPFIGPVKPPPIVAEVKAPPPPPPPIPLKFYGFVFSKRQGAKRAFFMEGEEIYIAAEGESMKNGRYRLVKIGVNSATVEDTTNKNQQALPLVEEQQPAAGG
jgi:hypothetical protein